MRWGELTLSASAGVAAGSRNLTAFTSLSVCSKEKKRGKKKEQDYGDGFSDLLGACVESESAS